MDSNHNDVNKPIHLPLLSISSAACALCTLLGKESSDGMSRATTLDAVAAALSGLLSRQLGEVHVLTWMMQLTSLALNLGAEDDVYLTLAECLSTLLCSTSHHEKLLRPLLSTHIVWAPLLSLETISSTLSTCIEQGVKAICERNVDYSVFEISNAMDDGRVLDAGAVLLLILNSLHVCRPLLFIAL